MATRFALIVAAVLLTAGAAACGGGGGGPTATQEVRSQQGLLVAAALQAGQRAQDQLSGAGEGDGSAAPGAQTRDTGTTDIAAAAYSLSNDGLTVSGYGMAAASADSAILEMYFSTTAVYPRTDEGGSSGSSDSGQTTPSVASISESDLQPVIDALVNAGVARSDIEYIGGSYYDPYYASATLRVTVRDLANLGNVVQTANDAASGLTNVYLQSSYVSYTLNDCAALERAALDAAVSDAGARATTLAAALGVTRGAIQGASDGGAYWPYGGTACSSGYAGPYPLGGVAYAEGQSQQVTVYSTVSITYAMQ